MTAWLWIANAAVLILGTVAAIRGGRAAMLTWLDRIAHLAICIGIGELARQTLGWPLGLVVVPPVVVATWFGGSTLGTVNFLVLQWFGVRAVRSEARCNLCGAKPGYGCSDDCPGHPQDSPIWRANYRPSLTLLRWVWPLTGWWSEYRWIARRR